MAEEYAKNLGAISHSCGIAFVLALAKDCGVLTTLKESNQPLTSHDIADKNQLKERYVREILGALTASNIVRLTSPSEGPSQYYITDEEKTALTGLTWAMLSIGPVIGSVYDKACNCCSESGPLGYFYDAKIQQAIERFTACSVDGNIKTILANSPGLKEKLATGIDVIEFGAGSCHLLSVIATQFPNSRFTASEFDLELLQKTRTRWASISNMCIQSQDICSDSEDFPNKQYDWVLSVDLIHDLSKPQIALNNFRKAVKEDGILLCTFIEPATSMYGTHAETVGNPVAATYYTLSTFMCIPESYHEADSATLGAACGKKVMIDMATKAGFLVEEFNMPPSTSLYVCTPVTK